MGNGTGFRKGIEVERKFMDFLGFYEFLGEFEGNLDEI
jgi:hypothetical protein